MTAVNANKKLHFVLTNSSPMIKLILKFVKGRHKTDNLFIESVTYFLLTPL